MYGLKVESHSSEDHYNIPSKMQCHMHMHGQTKTLAFFFSGNTSAFLICLSSTMLKGNHISPSNLSDLLSNQEHYSNTDFFFSFPFFCCCSSQCHRMTPLGSLEAYSLKKQDMLEVISMNSVKIFPIKIIMTNIPLENIMHMPPTREEEEEEEEEERSSTRRRRRRKMG